MDEQQMKYYPLISTFVAVFAVALLLLRGCDKPHDNTVEQENWELKNRVAELEDSLGTVNDSLSHLKALRRDEILAHQKDSTKRVKQIVGLSRGYQKAKEEIQHLRDSLPEVDRFAHAADSLISAKDSLYVKEVNHRIALEQLHSFEMAAMAKKNILQVEISEEYKARAEISERKLVRSEKRLERKKVWNTIWKSTTAAFVAVTTVLILTE